MVLACTKRETTGAIQATHVPFHTQTRSLSHPVCLQATYDKLKSEVPKYKMITTSILSDRLKVRTDVLQSSLHTVFVMDTQK